MDAPYLDYLFLDAFSRQENQKLKTLYYAFTGKRTVSVLYNALKNDVASHTAFFPSLRLPQLEAILLRFCQEGVLEEREDAFSPTRRGRDMVSDFFSSHQRLKNPDQLRFTIIVPKFAERSLFLLQVLSEVMYDNTDYLPVNNKPEDQRYLKWFLKNAKQPRKELAVAYGREWLDIVETAPVEYPNIFLEQAEGHGLIRKTARQTAERHDISPAEVHVSWQQGWLAILGQLDKQPERFPLLTTIFQDLKKSGGLASASTQETYLLLEKGYTPDQIVKIRKLKSSTVHDHILEMAMVYLEFPFERFLSPERLLFVERRLGRQEPLEYVAIQEAFPDSAFFEGRLMQIMLEMRRIEWRP